MKKHCFIILAAVFAAMGVHADDYIKHLGIYFQEFKFDQSELTIKIASSTTGYLVMFNDLEPRAALYGESIVVKKNDTLALGDREGCLQISHNKDLIQGELAKADIKGLEPFFDIIFYVKEVIDLRPIGRELHEKWVLIFLTETLSEDSKKVLLQALEDNRLTVNASDDQILWTEFKLKDEKKDEKQ